MSDFTLRTTTGHDRDAVAELIRVSTNAWYAASGKPEIFTGGAGSTGLFCDVYEDLDPGCCVVAEETSTGRLAGSCFYHPRQTHVSLGIMNAHPDFFRRGVARRLLRFVTDVADAHALPVRLVSSAMNLDSFSLYTRAGFVPRAVFQDMYLDVPAQGLPVSQVAGGRVRPARPEDAAAMAELEMELSHIRREKDYDYFLANARGIWHASVFEKSGGGIDGFLVSVNHPASNMLGPGVMRSNEIALALIVAELNQHRGRRPVFLVPSDRNDLVAALYPRGARNCEIHFAQVRGKFEGFAGVVMPTFMPETG